MPEPEVAVAMVLGSEPGYTMETSKRKTWLGLALVCTAADMGSVTVVAVGEALEMEVVPVGVIGHGCMGMVTTTEMAELGLEADGPRAVKASKQAFPVAVSLHQLPVVATT